MFSFHTIYTTLSHKFFLQFISWNQHCCPVLDHIFCKLVKHVVRTADFTDYLAQLLLNLNITCPFHPHAEYWQKCCGRSKCSRPQFNPAWGDLMCLLTTSGGFGTESCFKIIFPHWKAKLKSNWIQCAAASANDLLIMIMTNLSTCLHVLVVRMALYL